MKVNTEWPLPAGSCQRRITKNDPSRYRTIFVAAFTCPRTLVIMGVPPD
jgi:hypothetical protein